MKNVHFIAIGGSAMHNLAIAMHLNGVKITGSDDTIFEPSRGRLAKYGLLPEKEGWNENNIHNGLNAVILGMHAHADNPELAKAKKLGLKIFSYPEFLYEKSKNKTRVVIGGSHGKTSITAMILHVLHFHNKEVDYMVGAMLDGFEVMVNLTEENEFMVLEGDEYLSSTLDPRSKFLLYKPNIALISGIAWDHVNVFPTFDDYIQQFRSFIESISDGGVVIYNDTDEVVKKLIDDTIKPLRKLPYSIPSHFIENGKTFLETEIGSVPLGIFGKHNLNNLEGARLICNQLGVMDESFFEAIVSFKGASKRLELIKQTTDCKVYKDFAHAPSKVISTSNAVKEQFKDSNVIACLELHTYSSLSIDFLKQYKGALSSADEAIVYYSPKTLENKRLASISAQDIKRGFDRDDLKVFTDAKELEKHLKNTRKEKDNVFLMMSSGSWGGMNLAEIG